MREELPGRPCWVAAAMNLIGEKWALLAVREIAFGNKRFDAIARDTGAPRRPPAPPVRAPRGGARGRGPGTETPYDNKRGSARPRPPPPPRRPRAARRRALEVGGVVTRRQ